MEISTRLTFSQGRKFAFQVGVALAIFGALSAFRGHVWLPRVLWTMGATLILAGWLLPHRLSGLYVAWMKLAHLLSKVTAPVAMGVIYFGVMMPTGLLMRLLGRNPVRRVEKDGGFWISPVSGGRSDLDQQF